MNINDVTNVLNNLKTILVNKEKIANSDKGEIIISPDIGQFTYYHGVCKNADLWSLDELVYTYKAGNKIKLRNRTLMDRLATIFILTKEPNFVYGVTRNRTIAYPIDDAGFEFELKWMNPERWEYVEFLIDHLERIIEDESQIIEIIKVSDAQ